MSCLSVSVTEQVLTHVNIVEAQFPHVGMMQKLEEWSTYSDVMLVTEPWFKIMFIANSPCVASKSESNVDWPPVELILIKKSIAHRCLHAIEATIVIPDHDPNSVVSIYIPPSSDKHTFTLDVPSQQYYQHEQFRNSETVLETHRRACKPIANTTKELQRTLHQWTDKTEKSLS
ncbi:hypothetical protein TNCV_5050821 [Trichonephila clavipes]|nr:hypothetical protein TNCV_5050821 [Trichonephila clavipes]